MLCSTGTIVAPKNKNPFAKKTAVAPTHRRMVFFGAGNGTRTRDPELGRLALYQLSYSRSLRRTHHYTGGEGRIRTSVGISRQIYSLLPLATREPLLPRLSCRPSRWRESNSQPPDYKSGALPLSYIGKALKTEPYSQGTTLSRISQSMGRILASGRSASVVQGSVPLTSRSGIMQRAPHEAAANR